MFHYSGSSNFSQDKNFPRTLYEVNVFINRKSESKNRSFRRITEVWILVKVFSFLEKQVDSAGQDMTKVDSEGRDIAKVDSAGKNMTKVISGGWDIAKVDC